MQHIFGNAHTNKLGLTCKKRRFPNSNANTCQILCVCINNNCLSICKRIQSMTCNILIATHGLNKGGNCMIASLDTLHN